MSQETDQAPSSPATNPFNEEFGSYAVDLLKRWNAAGVSVAVVDGESVFSQGYGIATLPDTLATAETLYYTGSTTKAFTASLIDLLIQSKRYPELAKGWNTPISSLIHDDFVLEDEWATAHVTLNDAVGHMAGFSAHDLSNLEESGGHKWGSKETVRNMRNLPMVAEPRKSFIYSNHMYCALAHVAETLTGKWLGDLFQEHIFSPLQMTATFMDEHDAQAAPEHLAMSYCWSDETQAYKALPLAPARAVAGAGGMISNVSDYAKWVKCMIHETEPFSEATHKEIRTPRSIMDADDKDVSHYSLGWIRSIMFGKVVYSHSGSTGTFGTAVFWIPELKYGVVAFSNSFNSAIAVTQVLSKRLIQDKLGLTGSARVDEENKARAARQRREEARARVIDTLYPDRPRDRVLPSSADIMELAGKYVHPGYGTFDFRVVDHPDEPSSTKVLEARRPDCFFAYRMLLEHVSGDFWVAKVRWLHTGTADRCDKARVVLGVDGKPAGIELQLKEAGLDEGTIVLQRRE